MATTYELSFFETDAGLTGTTFMYGFESLAESDIRVSGYTGATHVDISSTIQSVNTATKTVTLLVAPSTYTKIRIFRATTLLPIVEFTSGAVLSEDLFNTAYKHSLFAAQEVSQDAGDATNRSIIYSHDISDGAIITSKIATDAVTSDKLADNSVLDEHISNNNVITSKIADLAVTNVKLASDAVTTSKIIDAAVTANKLAAVLDLSAKTLTLPPVNSPFSNQLFYAVEEKASGVAGGSSNAASYSVRQINTVIENSIAGVSLNTSTYQITLPAGKYFFDYSASGFNVNAHFTVIYQVSPTPAGIIGNGNNAYSGSTDNTASISNGSNVILLTAASTVIDLRHYTTTTELTNGLGQPASVAGRNERYAGIKIWKIA